MHSVLRPRPRRLTTALYDKLHEEVELARSHAIWIILVAVLWLLALVLFSLLFLVDAKLPPLEGASLAAMSATLLIFLPLFGRLMARNLNRSDTDQKLITVVFDFLHKRNVVSAVELDALDKRAEIGMNAGQLRTLFPLLALPVAFPFIVQLVQLVINPMQPILVYSLIYLGIGILLLFMVLLSFFQEVERANRDAVIRHALVEYRKPAHFQQLHGERERDAVQHILKRHNL